MAKPADESYSDGLEIVSIGALYSGQLDKKYWSSSRGKDRYPYPVGYHARRTLNGGTYKMEVHEGTKGPIFQITSDNDQSESGDTPDRAWANFQKKYCSRVKLWPGKRFSGKVDGVEFFGFKNALVQRLLRELVATINDASDQSSRIANFTKASAKGRDVGHPLKCHSPELVSFLGKTRVTGKRSRTCKGVDTKSACKKSHRISQPLIEAEDPCYSKTANNDEPMIISTSTPCGINQADGPSLLLSDMELGKNITLSADVLPFKSIEVRDDSIAKSPLADGQSGVASMVKHSSSSFADLNVPEEEKKPLDRQCTRVLGNGVSVVTEEENGNPQIIPDGLDSRPPVLMDAQVNLSVELCVPDTLDNTQQDSGDVKREKATSMTEVVADTICSKETINGSHSEDASSYLTGSSEKSDFDTFGEDITKTMLSILLPRAIPFLTYSSRKKKRKPKPSEELTCAPKSEDKVVGLIPCIDVISPASMHVKTDMEEAKRADPPCVHTDQAGLGLENVKYIVPDSLDDDQSEDFAAKKLHRNSNNADNVIVNFQENREPYGKSGLLNTAELLCDNSPNINNTYHKTRGFRKTLSHDEPLNDCDMRTQVDGDLVSHPTVGCQSFIPTIQGEHLCSNAEANSLYSEHSPKNMKMETILVGKADFRNDSAELTSYTASKNSLPGDSFPKKEEYSVPLSETIICRNDGDKSHPETNQGAELSGSCRLFEISNSDGKKTAFDVHGKLERQFSYTEDEIAEEAFAQINSLSVLQEHALPCAFTKDGAKCIDRFDVHDGDSEACLQKDKIGALHCESADPSGGGSQNRTSCIVEDIADTGVNSLVRQKSHEIEGGMKLIGCYNHPMQISSVKLAEIGHEIYICVSCGAPVDGERDLFLYKLLCEEPYSGSPCMIGHTSMRLPSLKDEFGRQVVIDKSGVQFTPDARALVLMDSIRMPYCREKSLHCSCPQCASCCFEENAVKIVQIQRGYALLILKLYTVYAVHCILVCEPQSLIVVDESGRIYIWIMDPTWSMQMEEHIILSYDFLPSRVVELKKVPKSASMVIGHNGYGQFSIWDIAKRTVVKQFSAPASSVLDYHPVSLFRWQNKCLSRDKSLMEECVKKLVEKSTSWFSGHNEVDISCPADGKDAALWVLMCTSSDSNVPSASFSSNYHLNSDHSWRLGLLVKNTVIMGAALPTSTAAIGTSSGLGITGTYKGEVDLWDLATGNQLGSLHHHDGKAVSHVAVNDASSFIVAVAHDGGQLRVYMKH
ncbi:hypothetical protein vseg_001745 [Gypsophila vaccaria]